MYTNAIHAWSKHGNSFGANRALQILNMMFDEYNVARSELKDEDEDCIKVVRPDAFHYAAVRFFSASFHFLFMIFVLYR